MKQNNTIFLFLPLDNFSRIVQNGICWEKLGNQFPNESKFLILGNLEDSFEVRKNMLLGQYEAKIDTEARIALPKRFRDHLGEKVILTFGYENSLILVSESSWKTLLSGTEGRPFIEYETRDTQRFLLGGASHLALDSKGRFILPSYLRKFGKLGNEVIFLGLSSYVEIWDKEHWIEYQKYLEKNIERISQKLIRSQKEEDKK